MFRIKKRNFVLVGIIICVVVLLLLIYFFFVPQRSLCDSEKLVPPCSVTLSTTGDVSVITGVLVSKYERGDKFYFQMVTRDKNNKSFTFIFTNPPNFPKMIIDKITLPSDEKLPTNPLGKTMPVKDFYNLVNPQMPLRVFIYNPKKLTESQIAQAPEALRKCNLYQISVLEYLENPSLKANILSNYFGLKDGCQLVVANVSI